ncbi:DUF2946 family protein [Brevundimonas sp. SL130]|uniref:DUF2946 family protein n=1 Tax=Brevundimonas sp. SL130 TaxID=2995143 RepID=UPI003B638B1F
MLGSLLPTTASALTSTTAVILCSGDQMAVAVDANGRPTPDEPAPIGAIKCPLCVLVATSSAMLPPPEPSVQVQAPVFPGLIVPTPRVTPPAALSLWTRRLPPATAPPAA